MRLFIIIILAVTLVSCASGGSVMKYSYLPESDYHYYKPLKPDAFEELMHDLSALN